MAWRGHVTKLRQGVSYKWCYDSGTNVTNKSYLCFYCNQHWFVTKKILSNMDKSHVYNLLQDIGKKQQCQSQCRANDELTAHKVIIHVSSVYKITNINWKGGEVLKIINRCVY